MGRHIDTGRITSERQKLQECLEKVDPLETRIAVVSDRDLIPNPVREDIVGLYRSPNARKAVVADEELLAAFKEAGLDLPSFLEAGPRAQLRFDPHHVRAAIVTTGGLAPGLHCVIHAIVKRHCNTYGPNDGVLGVFNSFRGLCDLGHNYEALTPVRTEEWLDQGGSQLGIVRYFHEVEGKPNANDDERIAAMADKITENLVNNNIDILYIIGGDGSLRVVHKLAEHERNQSRSIVGIPKTMDNDILWVWQSFGFDTAVEQATRTINTLRSEAEGTRRICLVELFGAESGFVAANAALASGHVDAVLIPEVFEPLTPEQATEYVLDIVRHIKMTVQGEPFYPHAVVVIAEGVGTFLEKKDVVLAGAPIDQERHKFVDAFKMLIEKNVSDAYGEEVPVFINQPRHYIRAVPANAHDQIYCERLGALAVDNALGGYSGFMMSQWLTEYVLVPTRLVIVGQKSIPVKGMFWKQVVSSTQQPLSPSERISS